MALQKVCQADPFVWVPHTQNEPALFVEPLAGLNVRGWDTDIVGLLQEVNDVGLEGAVFGLELVIRSVEFCLGAVDEKVTLHPPLLQLVQLVVQVSCLRSKLFLF